jgi:hypothetical protein
MALISAANGASLFVTARTYPGGEGVNAAAVRDFNNDGSDDVVTANLQGKNVTVFVNSGNGTFGVSNDFSVGGGAIDVASDDHNDDGNADLVVTDANTSVHVALGNGDGTFEAFSAITLHSQPQGIAIADLNGDGILDLAIAILGPAHTFDGEVAILIGAGDGSFASPVFYQLGGQQGNRLVATDLNDDAKPDLAVAIQHGVHPRDGLAVLLGNGDGTFQSAVVSLPGVNANDVAAADLNRDGKTDLALANGSSVNGVEVVLGNGDGTFQSPTAYSTGGGAKTVSLVDVNRDGLADLVVGTSYTAILFGDGDGNFGPAIIYRIGQNFDRAFARAGDFNQDQTPDIVGNGVSSEIAVAFGHTNGVYGAPRAYPIGLRGLDSADFDGDGSADVVVGGTLGQLLFLHGNGDGTLGDPLSFANLNGEDVVAADFNGDGKQDILAVPRDGNLIYTILGNGDGTFQSATATSVPVDLDDSDSAVGDFNLDSKPDVVVTDFDTNSLIVWLGNGDGTFQPATTYETPNGPEQPTLADFNVDGNLDVAVSNGFVSRVSIFLGHGDGTFDPPLKTESRSAVYLAAGDLNLDGKPDLAVAAEGINVFLGNGDGTFGLAERVCPNDGPVRIADIDLDGRPDLVFSDFSGTTRLVGFRGNGDGTFRPAVDLVTGEFLTLGPFILKDLNGDEAPEVIVRGIDSPLSVLVNASRRHR